MFENKKILVGALLFIVVLFLLRILEAYGSNEIDGQDYKLVSKMLVDYPNEKDLHLLVDEFKKDSKITNLEFSTLESKVKKLELTKEKLKLIKK